MTFDKISLISFLFQALRRETTGVGIVVTETARKTHALYSLKDPCQVSILKE
jgi:hypothetical protein